MITQYAYIHRTQIMQHTSKDKEKKYPPPLPFFYLKKVKFVIPPPTPLSETLTCFFYFFSYA